MFRLSFGKIAKRQTRHYFMNDNWGVKNGHPYRNLNKGISACWFFNLEQSISYPSNKFVFYIVESFFIEIFLPVLM